MPNCISFIRKSDIEAGAVSHHAIDDEMCRHFGVSYDEITWHHDWPNIIGFSLACGQTFDQIIAINENNLRASFSEGTEGIDTPDPWIVHNLEVIRWLADRFTVEAWAEIGGGR